MLLHKFYWFQRDFIYTFTFNGYGYIIYASVVSETWKRVERNLPKQLQNCALKRGQKGLPFSILFGINKHLNCPQGGKPYVQLTQDWY